MGLRSVWNRSRFGAFPPERQNIVSGYRSPLEPEFECDIADPLVQRAISAGYGTKRQPEWGKYVILGITADDFNVLTTEFATSGFCYVNEPNKLYAISGTYEQWARRNEWNVYRRQRPHHTAPATSNHNHPPGVSTHTFVRSESDVAGLHQGQRWYDR